jgi:hypothetical protein
MVGFDVPHVTNDMILRFMDVDVSLVAGQAASSKSRVGDDERVYLGLISSLAGAGVPLLKGGNTDWECTSSSTVLSMELTYSMVQCRICNFDPPNSMFNSRSILLLPPPSTNA